MKPPSDEHIEQNEGSQRAVDLSAQRSLQRRVLLEPREQRVRRRRGGKRLRLRFDAFVRRVQAIQRLLHVQRHVLAPQIAPQPRDPRGKRGSSGSRGSSGGGAEMGVCELEEELDGEIGVVVGQSGLLAAQALHILHETPAEDRPGGGAARGAAAAAGDACGGR